MTLHAFTAMKKIRWMLAVLAIAGCTAAFAADSSYTAQEQYAGYACRWDRGHHHGCDW